MEVLGKIARINKKENIAMSFHHSSLVVSDKKQDIPIFTFFKSRRILFNYIGTFVNYMTIPTGSYYLAFNLKNVAGNIFVNSCFSSIATFVSCLFAFFLSSLWKTDTILKIAVLVSMISALPLLLIHE